MFQSFKKSKISEFNSIKVMVNNHGPVGGRLQRDIYIYQKSIYTPYTLHKFKIMSVIKNLLRKSMGKMRHTVDGYTTNNPKTRKSNGSCQVSSKMEMIAISCVGANIKNKSVKWLVENDKQYFNWMCKNQIIKKKWPLLKENLNEFKTHN